MRTFTVLLGLSPFAVGCLGETMSLDTGSIDIQPEAQPSDIHGSQDPETENPYNCVKGEEDFTYARSRDDDEDFERSCEVFFEYVNTRTISPIPRECPDCEFVFEIDLVVEDVDDLIGEDSDCSGVSFDVDDDWENVRYGYANGMAYYRYADDVWVPWAEATFDGEDFEYWTGYVDYPYDGGYYTWFWRGEAELWTADEDDDGDPDCE